MSKHKPQFRVATQTMSLEDACAYAIETVDNLKELRRALIVLERRFYGQSELIRVRLMAHARVAGFDNSEHMVKAL